MSNTFPANTVRPSFIRGVQSVFNISSLFTLLLWHVPVGLYSVLMILKYSDFRLRDISPLWQAFGDTSVAFYEAWQKMPYFEPVSAYPHMNIF